MQLILLYYIVSPVVFSTWSDPKEFSDEKWAKLKSDYCNGFKLDSFCAIILMSFVVMKGLYQKVIVYIEVAS